MSTACNQAAGFRANGQRLLTENPLRGLEWPREKNPRRPVASPERYIRTQEHTDTVDPAGRLRCILALARHTGARESAICDLRASDLLLSAEGIRAALAGEGMDEQLAEHMPSGAIRWRPESDKEGYLTVRPINRAAREAVDAYLHVSPRIGVAPLLPAPKDPEVPIDRDRATKWLVRAEQLAEQPKLVGGVFHPYRRLWASERRHLSDVDIAAAGGWNDTRALKQSYQHADPAGVLAAIMNGS